MYTQSFLSLSPANLGHSISLSVIDDGDAVPVLCTCVLRRPASTLSARMEDVISGVAEVLNDGAH